MEFHDSAHLSRSTRHRRHSDTDSETPQLSPPSKEDVHFNFEQSQYLTPEVSDQPDAFRSSPVGLIVHDLPGATRSPKKDLINMKPFKARLPGQKHLRRNPSSSSPSPDSNLEQATWPTQIIRSSSSSSLKTKVHSVSPEHSLEGPCPRRNQHVTTTTSPTSSQQKQQDTLSSQSDTDKTEFTDMTPHISEFSSVPSIDLILHPVNARRFYRRHLRNPNPVFDTTVLDTEACHYVATSQVHRTVIQYYTPLGFAHRYAQAAREQALLMHEEYRLELESDQLEQVERLRQLPFTLMIYLYFFILYLISLTAMFTQLTIGKQPEFGFMPFISEVQYKRDHWPMFIIMFEDPKVAQLCHRYMSSMTFSSSMIIVYALKHEPILGLLAAGLFYFAMRFDYLVRPPARNDPKPMTLPYIYIT